MAGHDHASALPGDCAGARCLLTVCALEAARGAGGDVGLFTTLVAWRGLGWLDVRGVFLGFEALGFEALGFVLLTLLVLLTGLFGGGVRRSCCPV